MGYQGSAGGAGYGGTYSGGGVQRFDTGLYRPVRSVIRQAIIDRLGTTPTGNGKPLLKALGGYIAKIAPLPRPLKGESDDERGFVFIALQGASPALLVALGDMDFEPLDGNEEYLGELEVVVYSFSDNLRSFVDGRLSPDAVAAGDPTADPGIETTLEHVRELLCGQEVDIIGVHELRPKREAEVFTYGDGSLWEHRFAAKVQVSINPERAKSDPVKSIEVQQDIDDGDDSPFTVITDLEVP
jgi:hypothetical protein